MPVIYLQQAIVSKSWTCDGTLATVIVQLCKRGGNFSSIIRILILSRMRCHLKKKKKKKDSRINGENRISNG